MNPIEHHIKEKRSIDLVKANSFALLLFPIFGILYFLPYFLIWEIDFSSFDALKLAIDIPISIVILILGIILHELIHGITWALFAKNGFKSIKFGVLWKMLTPYCHCSEPLRKNHYFWGAVMPFIVLGFFPAVMAIATGSFYWLLFGFLFSIAAAGDFMVIFLILKEENGCKIEDHPSEVGYFVYKEEIKSVENQ